MRKLVFLLLLCFSSYTYAYEYEATYYCVKNDFKDNKDELNRITFKVSNSGSISLDISMYINYSGKNNPFSIKEWQILDKFETYALRSSTNPEHLYFDYALVLSFKDDSGKEVAMKEIYHWQIFDNKKQFIYSMDRIQSYDDKTIMNKSSSYTVSGNCYLVKLEK